MSNLSRQSVHEPVPIASLEPEPPSAPLPVAVSENYAFNATEKRAWLFNPKGLGRVEPLHRWTIGPRAEFSFRLPAGTPQNLTVELSARGFNAPSAPDISADVFCNGALIGALRSDAGLGLVAAQIARGHMLPDGTVTISIEVHEPCRPCDFGLNNDRRLLGFNLISLRVTETAEPKPSQTQPPAPGTPWVANPDMPFRYLCSIGYNCAAAYQIRRSTRLSESGLFDWLFTSLHAAEKLILNDCDGFMQKHNLEIVRGGLELYDRGSGIRFNHSFKPAGSQFVSPALIADHFDNEKSKFAYLAKKFGNMLDDEGNVCFVRYTPTLDHPDSIAAIRSLSHAIRFRRKQRPFTILWIHNTGKDCPAVWMGQDVVKVEFAEDTVLASFIGTDNMRWSHLLESLPLELISRRRHPDDPSA